MKNFEIKNAFLVDPYIGSAKKRDIWIIDGKIRYKKPTKAVKTELIEATGCVILPGLIDLRCHLGKGGEDTGKNIENSCKAAIAGGYTKILAMPDFSPLIDNTGSAKLVQSLFPRSDKIDVLLAGSLTVRAEGSHLSPLGSLKDAGIVAVTDCPQTTQNNQIFTKGIQYAKMFDLPIIELPVEKTLSMNSSAHDGAVSLSMGLNGFPRLAEELFVQRSIIISRDKNVRIHLSSISSEGSVEMIRMAKKKKIKITADTSVNHLLFTDMDIQGYDTNFKLLPPLREEKDREALIKGVLDGTLDAINSSHEAHQQHKKNIEFDLAPEGVISLETALSVVDMTLAKKLPKQQRYLKIAKCMAENPERIISNAKIHFEENERSDLIIYDPKVKWKYDASSIMGDNNNSPLHGKQLCGKVIYTFKKGRIVYKYK